MQRRDYVRLVRKRIKDTYGVDAAAPAESSPISCPSCGRPAMKAVTLLFGGSLPEASSAAAVALEAPPSTRRALINREPAGPELDLGSGGGDGGWGAGGGGGWDLFLQGGAEDVRLARLGWLDGLAAAAGELPPASRALLDARITRRGAA